MIGFTEQIRQVRISGECVVQPPCSKQGQQEQSAQDCVQLTLNISKNGDSTGQPVPVFDHPYSKKKNQKSFFLRYRGQSQKPD